MAGRHPTPTALKKLRGNPGKRALAPDPLQSDIERPACPAWLDADAKAEWARLIGVLHSSGIVKSVDRSALAAHCVAYSRWQRLELAAKKHGAGVIKSEKGNWYMNPHVLMAQAALKEMLATAAQLGLTPVSRAKVSAAKTQTEKSLADVLFEGANGKD